MAKRVLVGMSGGVDSSVAAMLLKEQGYEVTGMTMRLRPEAMMAQCSAGGCCSLDDIDDARRVCYKLGIDHIVMNFTEDFARDVMDYFADEYSRGRTPNPCIACNRRLKFGSALRRAMELDFDYIATGHYAVRREENGRALLYRSKSPKDQSYVLYGMTPFQLQHTLFPLESMDKAVIREMAQKADLPVAHKPDSQDICFVENGDYAAFLHEYRGICDRPGEFLDEEGNVIGQHKGIFHYTIGQRKGLGSFGAPRYVIGIHAKENAVTLGPEGTQYRSELVAEDCNFIPFDHPDGELRVQAKVRYQAKPSPAVLQPQADGTVRVIFDTPQRSVTPGQAVVFYDDDLLVGGGTIQ